MADPTIVASGFIGSPGGETTNASTRSLTLPTVAENDWLVIGPTIAGGSTTVLIDGVGWDDQAAQQIATRSGYATHGFAKQLTAGNSGAVLTLATSTAIKAATPWAIIRGLKPGQTPVWRTPVTGLSANAMTPPAFTPAPGKVLVHLIGMATASAAPPSVGAWTTPTGITLTVAATMGGTTGRAGAAIGAQLHQNEGISGDWDSDASSSWGIIAVEFEFEVASTALVPVPATVHVGAASFDWQNQAASDALYSSAPSLSTSTGATSSISGATLVAPDDARLRYRGGEGFAFGTGTPDSSCYQPSSRYPNGWGNPAAFAVSFIHTGTEFELLYKWLSAVGAGWFRISVDGQRLTDLMYDIPGTSGGSMTKTKVTFASSATRHILVEVQGVPFGGVYLGAGNTITQAPAFSRRLITQGDSILAGSDGNTGGSAGTWVARFARYAGTNIDVMNQAIGGTGMVTPGTAVAIPDRLADVTSYAPDDVILWCGGNDGSTSIVAEATQWIADVKAAVPDVRGFVVGTWSPTVVASAARAARSADLKAAAAANGWPFIEPITGEVYDGDGVLVASQRPWIATAGDVATYVYSGDNVHPTDAGHAYIAQRMVQAMQALGEPITVDVSTPRPTVTAGATVEAPTAAGSARALAPTVSGGARVDVPLVSVTAAALAPSVGLGATMQAPSALVGVSAVGPSVSAGARVDAPTAQATATAPTPQVGAGATVAATTALGVVTSPAPTVTAGAWVAPLPATVSVAAPEPSASAGGATLVMPPPAVVDAVALPPHLTAGARVDASTARLTCGALAPTITAGARVTPARAVAVVYALPATTGLPVVVVPSVRRLVSSLPDRMLTAVVPDRVLEGGAE